MLIVGLPGVIFLGTITAALLFDTLSLSEAAILGTILAATDAALGKAVITNKAVPVQIREGLNIESGLNDGLCVPILFVFIALALGSGTEGGSTMLALMTWMLFGATVIGQSVQYFTWEMLVYALLSLTVIRMLPIFLSLIGTGESTASKLFLGWFGPRGLASIVFAIIVLSKGVPAAKFIAMVVVLTVFFSLVAHGVSANPLAKLLGQKEGTKKISM